MIAAQLMDRANKAGIRLSLKAGSLSIVRPQHGNNGLVQEIKDNKDAIRYELIKTKYDLPWPSYDKKITNPERLPKLNELMKDMDADGCTLFWSDLYSDPIAFHRDDVDSTTVPEDFIPYSESELAIQHEHLPSWELIHIAKRKLFGAHVTQAPAKQML